MSGDANPYVSHSDAEQAQMLSVVGADSVEDLFDVPDGLRFDGDLGIERRDERTARREVRATLGENADVTEFLGRGHYAHYVPAVVDDLADRSEFLTSYTQYQPEIAQGFLQALFEYQSLLVELTGLSVANASMYDAATALGEAALLADRVRETDGDTVFVRESGDWRRGSRHAGVESEVWARVGSPVAVSRETVPAGTEWAGERSP